MSAASNATRLGPDSPRRNNGLASLGECFGDWLAYEIPSDRAPGVRYLTVLNLRTGEAECDCPDFTARGQERPCKHIRRVIMSSQQLAQAAIPAPILAQLATEEARYKAIVAKRETLARTLMPANASPAQVDAFCLLCAKYGLDPFTGEAWAFPKPGGGIQFMPGYRAFLRRAQEHPEFEFLRFGVVMAGEKCTVNMATGEVSHEASLDSDGGTPVGVWWQAKRSGRPVMAGRILLKNVQRASGAWKDSPVQMLRKAALTEACMSVFGLASPTPSNADDDDVIEIPAGGYFELPPAEAEPAFIDVVTGEIVESAGAESTVGSEPDAPAESVEGKGPDDDPFYIPAGKSCQGPTPEQLGMGRPAAHNYHFTREQIDTIELRRNRAKVADLDAFLQEAWDDYLDEAAVVARITALAKGEAHEGAA